MADIYGHIFFGDSNYMSFFLYMHLSGITIQFSSIFQLIIGTENKMGMFNRMRINRIHCWPPYHAQNYFQRYNNCLKN